MQMWKRHFNHPTFLPKTSKACIFIASFKAHCHDNALRCRRCTICRRYVPSGEGRPFLIQSPTELVYALYESHDMHGIVFLCMLRCYMRFLQEVDALWPYADMTETLQSPDLSSWTSKVCIFIASFKARCHDNGLRCSRYTICKRYFPSGGRRPFVIQFPTEIVYAVWITRYAWHSIFMCGSMLYAIPSGDRRCRR